MQYVEVISKDKTLRGMHHFSKCEDSFPVIIVHGYFSANRIGPQRLFVKMATAIAESGFDVYRFDLSGMGESDGDISKTTFFDHVDDVKAIIEYVQQKHYCKKVCVVAHCLGCDVTLANIIDNPNLFREIIFLAPYYTTDEIMSAFFNKESIQQLSKENYTYRKGLFAHASFFNESKQNDFVNRIINTPVMLNVIVPEEDQFIPLESNKRIFDSITLVNTIYIEGADHNFLQTNEKVISCVVRLLNDKRYTV